MNPFPSLSRLCEALAVILFGLELLYWIAIDGGPLGEVRCGLRPLPFLFLSDRNIAGAFAYVVSWVGVSVWYKRVFCDCSGIDLPLPSSPLDILLTLSKR